MFECFFTASLHDVGIYTSIRNQRLFQKCPISEILSCLTIFEQDCFLIPCTIFIVSSAEV